MKLEKVEWREFGGNGILEGLKFHWNNGVSSEKYGEAKRYDLQESINTADNEICVIKITFCDMFITSMAF